MTASTRPAIHLRQPGELLAAVPHLLGFHPVDSLVLVTHRGPERTSVGLTLRTTLPPAEHYEAVARQLLEPVLRHAATGVTLVVIGSGPDDPQPDLPGTLPGRELIELLWPEFTAAGVPVLHALWAPATRSGQPWCCYLDRDCHGEVPDPESSVLAAASAVTGVVTYRSREELAALLGPDDADAIARRAAMLEEAALASQATGETISLPDKVAHVMASIAAGASAGTTLSDEIVVRLARELSDHQVRDACLLSAGPEQAMAAEWLWAALTRMTPAPERAEAACLLAVSAYLRGDGALAGVALECAEEADPGHQLTSLLRQVQQAGLPPDWLASTLRRSVAMAKRSAAEGVG